MTEVAALGAVARFCGGGTPSKSQASFWNGDIPWVSPKDMWVDEVTTAEDKITAEAVRKSATNLVPTQSILCVVRSGILARKFPVALTGREVAINQDIKAIIPGKKLDARYLFYFLRASEPGILASVTTGATVHRVGTDALKALEIPLPPLEEQRRIVALLDEVFAAIAIATANAEKNLANAHELFDSELNTTFGKAHPDWRRCLLSDLMDITHGFAFKGEDFEASDDETKPIVLTPGNYTENAEISYSPRNTKRLVHGAPPSAFRFRAGDLTVVMTDLSSKMKILGRPAFVDDENILHNQRIGKVVFRDSSIEPRLIYYAMQTSASLSRIRDTATGTMVRHTAPKRILANRIAYPPNTGDQRVLVERLDGVRLQAKALRELQLAKIKTLAALKASLLHRAFTGELTATVSENIAA
ncbi:restriction endonuclease subunit S [Sphingopyxis sp. LARHCG72]